MNFEKKTRLKKLPDDAIINDEIQIINRGTGAGGANTNVNGLSYEDKTDLSSLYVYCVQDTNENKIIKFTGYECEFINVSKTALHKYMTDIGERNANLQPASGCKQPDEAYINHDKKTIFIIEKKFQQTSGSVDEKIQTGPFKKYHYGKLFPGYAVHYIYCLSDWFKREEYASVLEYLTDNGIPIFWGNDANYKSLIVDFICSTHF